jgi:hypothetical protein
VSGAREAFVHTQSGEQNRHGRAGPGPIATRHGSRRSNARPVKTISSNVRGYGGCSWENQTYTEVGRRPGERQVASVGTLGTGCVHFRTAVPHVRPFSAFTTSGPGRIDYESSDVR